MPETPNEARLIFAEEFRRFTRNKRYLILTMSVPIILFVILGAVITVRAINESKEDEEQKPIGMVVLPSELAIAPDDFLGFVTLTSRQDGMDALLEETVKEVFIIPEDYLTTGRIDWLHKSGGVFSGFNPGPGNNSAAAVRAYLRIVLAGELMASDVLERAVTGAVFDRIRIDENGVAAGDDESASVVTFIISFASTILLMFSIIIGAGSLAQAVAEEKESRMMEVLLISVKPLSLMAGKVLAIGVGVLIMVTLWVGSLVLIGTLIVSSIPDLTDIPVNIGLLGWVLGFFLGGFFVSAVIVAGISSMATKVQEANQLAMLVIIPLVVPIYAMPVILSNPDEGLAQLLSFIPFTAPVAMMIRLGAGDPSTLESIASLVVIVVTGVVLLWASARLFRAGLLMYGQRMTLKGAIKAIRQSG